MIKKNKTRITFTITKEAAKLIQMRGGNKYILECLKEQICNHEVPNCFELEACGIYTHGKAAYEVNALHTKGNNWYEKLFPELYK